MATPTITAITANARIMINAINQFGIVDDGEVDGVRIIVVGSILGSVVSGSVLWSFDMGVTVDIADGSNIR